MPCFPCVFACKQRIKQFTLSVLSWGSSENHFHAREHHRATQPAPRHPGGRHHSRDRLLLYWFHRVASPRVVQPPHLHAHDHPHPADCNDDRHTAYADWNPGGDINLHPHSYDHLYTNVDGDVLYPNPNRDRDCYTHPCSADSDLHQYACPALRDADQYARPAHGNGDRNGDGLSNTLIQEGADV